MKKVKRTCRRPGRASVMVLPVAILVAVALAVGCTGSEKASEDRSGEDQTTAQEDAQGTGDGTTGESAEATTEALGGDVTGRENFSSREATLEIRGERGIGFSGTCETGGEETEVSGQVPESFSYQLDGRLECEISKEGADPGALEVAFTDGQNTRAVQQISGGTLDFTYDDGHISFSSSSSASGVQVVSSQVISSSQSGSCSVKVSP